jgi:hypothetical protein
MSYEVFSLGSLARNKGDRELLEGRLGEFCCARDEQLEKFIRSQAFFYESKGYGRTYLVFDTGDEDPDTFPPIAAFFTLALTATDYSGISRNKKEKVLGSKPGRNTFRSFAGILIGQLARDDRYGPSFIDGETLLRECENYIELGRQYLGGRIVYLDCKKPLIETYQKNSYRLLSDEPTDEGYYKMYKVLPDRVV